MNDTVYAEIEQAVAKRRSELEALPRSAVAEEFRVTFQIRPDLHADKANLIERILVKVRAELERRA